MYPFKWWKRQEYPEKVWIISKFRVSLFKRALELVGSMNALGRILGYRSRTHPGWSVRQMLLGFQPIPMDKLEQLAEITTVPLYEILEHQVPREAITVDGTNKALRDYGLMCYLLR
jgi:hypothetical protein